WRSGRTGNRLGVFGIVQALAKALDALRHVAHQIRNLAASAEQEKDDDRQDQNVPNAEATHGTLLFPVVWGETVLVKDPSGLNTQDGAQKCPVIFNKSADQDFTFAPEGCCQRSEALLNRL